MNRVELKNSEGKMIHHSDLRIEQTLLSFHHSEISNEEKEE